MASMRHLLHTAGMAVVSVAACAPAFAQTVTADVAPADQPASAGAPATADIVVTAQRRTQRLQDVPVAVSVVSGAALAQTNILSLQDISVRLPAVKIQSGPLTSFLNIRGVGSGQNAGFEQSVATFVDGIYRGRSHSTRAALFDVEQIEVLKGPQTTFFGNNAIAGALNITTRKPGKSPEYNGSALYAFEDGEYNVEGGVSTPLTESLGVRIAGRVSGMDGYIDNLTTGNDSPRDRDLLGRVSLRFEPSTTFRSDLRVDAGRSRRRGAIDAVLLNCPSPFAGPTDFACASAVAQNGGPLDGRVRYTSFAPENRTRYDFQEVAFTNSLDLSGLTLTSITGYFHHNYGILNPLVPTNGVGVGGNQLAPSPYVESVDQFSQEVRLQSEAGGTFEYMVGGYYSSLKTDLTSGFGFFFAPFGAFNPTGTTNASTPVGALNSQQYDDRSLSAFASATIRPIENIRVNLGARYSNVRKIAHRLASFGAVANGDVLGLTPFDPVTTAIFAAIAGSDLRDFPDPRRVDDKFMPSVGVQVDVTPDVMAYANYSKGFKAGGFSAANAIDTYEPENVDAYEIGLKSALLDRTLTLNLAAFLSDYKDLQETTIIFNGGVPNNFVANAASSRAKGVEASANWRVSSILSLSTDLAYIESRYRDYADGICTMEQTARVGVTCVQDLSGKYRPYAPKFSGNVGAELNLPIGDAYRLKVNPLVYFTSRFFTTASADPLLEQRGNTKVDLRVGFGKADGRWEVAVLGKNLTDKATAGYRNAQLAGNGTAFVLPDRPRAIALQVTFRN